ncbi:PREDICTED: E3 ubiquitin-protein ligase RLIM-like [Chinchilla lanigera]|uniref:E3 ubiquitin-protein ligase RLIM-like n=1 Tax=Chinchilla lanigera TaxID=34839 RepID=UPI00038EDA5F|nr:PREDICTED: E3 ubiquitin-protein ligase RLIM-like [Chinchilla lanigera]
MSHPFITAEVSDSSLDGVQSETSPPSRAKRLPGEAADRGSAKELPEEGYGFRRDNQGPGVRGQTKEVALLERQQPPGDRLGEPGAEGSADDHFETGNFTCFEHTEYMTESERRYYPPWISGNQSNSSSRDSRRRNSGQEHLSFPRGLREHVETTQSNLMFATSSTSQETTTETLVEEASSRSQRLRHRRQRNRTARRRAERGSNSNISSEHVVQFHDSISPEAFDQLLVSETETFSRNEPHEVFRQERSRPVLPRRDNFAAFGRSSNFQGEYSPHTTGNRESGHLQRTRTIRVPELQITIFPRVDPPSDDTGSIIPFIPNTVYNSDTVGGVLEEIRNVFPHAEEAGVTSHVGALRIPAFRNSNTSLQGTSSTASPGRTLEQTMTASSGSSTLMDTDSDVQCSGPPQNMHRAESQHRRDGSNLNRRFEPHHGATTTCNPSSSCTPGPSNHAMFSARSHNENPEIASEMFEGINERRAPVGSRSQPRQGHHTHSEILNELEAWQLLGEPFFLDLSMFLLLPGLTQEVIGNLPVRIFGKTEAEKSCSVCLSEYKEGSEIRTLPCFHEYHVHCIDPWLLNNSTCPVCRTEVTGANDRENS